MSTTGIQPIFEAFYIEAMRFNAASGAKSIKTLDMCLTELEQNPTSDALLAHTVPILDSVQNLVAQAAALSRYFWPVPKGKLAQLHESRAIRLRSVFSVNDDSPLKNRDLRNALEHFDERLDIRLQDPMTGHVLPQFVGGEPKDRSIPLHVFRAYFVDTGIFELLGERYEIEPIANEILRIDQLLENYSTAGGRFR